jgi:hypothetical protein
VIEAQNHISGAALTAPRHTGIREQIGGSVRDHRSQRT